jgi:WD40 repeat protein
VFQEHGEPVTSLALAPDGTTLAVGDKSGAVRLWDVGSRNERLHWQGHTGEVSFLVCLPDGRTWASAGADRTARIWDAATGRERAVFRHEEPITSLQVVPGGEFLTTHCAKGPLHLWDVAAGVERTTLPGEELLASSPDGTLLAIQEDHAVMLWELRTGRKRATLTGEGLGSATFAPDGKVVLTGTEHFRYRTHGEVKVWDLETGEEFFTLNPHLSWVGELRFDPKGRWLAATGGTWDFDAPYLHVWPAALASAPE